MIVMLIAIPLAAAGLMFAAAPSADRAGTADAVYSAASRQLPLAGSWSLDASAMPENERPQRVTMIFRASQDGKWKTSVEIVAQDRKSVVSGKSVSERVDFGGCRII